MIDIFSKTNSEQLSTSSESVILQEYRKLRRDLVKLRKTIIVCSLVIFGGLVAILVAVGNIDWFISTIIYFLVAYLVWIKLA